MNPSQAWFPRQAPLPRISAYGRYRSKLRASFQVLPPVSVGLSFAVQFYVTLPLSLCYQGYFFFQAEDGIRVHCVTGVQTCALPISGDDVAHDREGTFAL